MALLGIQKHWNDEQVPSIRLISRILVMTMESATVVGKYHTARRPD